MTFRKVMATGNDIVVCVGHLHRHAAQPEGKDRADVWDQLAVICVGGTRIVGLDANMAVFGVVDEMAKRGIDAHLCSIHAEYE